MGGGGGEGWTVRCFVPHMHFCIGKYQSVPRLLAMIVAMSVWKNDYKKGTFGALLPEQQVDLKDDVFLSVTQAYSDE